MAQTRCGPYLSSAASPTTSPTASKWIPAESATTWPWPHGVPAKISLSRHPSQICAAAPNGCSRSGQACGTASRSSEWRTKPWLSSRRAAATCCPCYASTRRARFLNSDLRRFALQSAERSASTAQASCPTARRLCCPGTCTNSEPTSSAAVPCSVPPPKSCATSTMPSSGKCSQNPLATSLNVFCGTRP